jgi:hypothetical protein
MTARHSNEKLATSQEIAEARERSAEVERQRKDGTLTQRATSREELSRMIEAERASRKR